MGESRFERHSRRAQASQERLSHKGELLMWYAGIDWADQHVRHVT
jgi:hypothetical protein